MSLLFQGGPVVDASFLLQLGLQDLLERDDIGEVVEVDVQAHVPLWQRCELTLHQLGLDLRHFFESRPLRT